MTNLTFELSSIANTLVYGRLCSGSCNHTYQSPTDTKHSNYLEKYCFRFQFSQPAAIEKERNSTKLEYNAIMFCS